MKSSILVVVILGWCSLLLGQGFKEKLNLGTYGGYHLQQQNTNNNGYWYGTYLDYLLIKSANGWSAGPYLFASNSGFNQNLSRYQADICEYGGGISFGYYQEAPYASKSLFLGFNIGLRQSNDHGESLGKTTGYEATQNDLMLSGGINLNLLKSPYLLSPWWPRTQILMSFLIPLRSNKESFWNKKELSNVIWDKTYFESQIKQSFARYSVSENWHLSPKLIAFYSFSAGDKGNYYGLGAELSVYKSGKDDLASIYYLVKANSRFDVNTIHIGVNFNLLSW